MREDRFAWVVETLATKAPALEVRVVRVGEFVVVVGAQGSKWGAGALEGVAEITVSDSGGVKAIGQFSLEAEGDAVREAFFEKFLSQFEEKKAKPYLSIASMLYGTGGDVE